MVKMVGIGLGIPFFAILLIVGSVYMVSGYKKDLGRSLVSVCATIVAVLVSMFGSKLAALALSAKVMAQVPAPVFEDIGILGSFAESIAGGLVQIVLAFSMFSIFLIICLIVLKSIGKRIRFGKLEALNFGTKKSKVASMAIRAVDAFIVSLFLLLPLYGVIAAVVPTASRVVRMTGVEGEAVEALTELENHPVVCLYKKGPAAWVSSGLSSFSLNGENVNVLKTAETVSGILGRVEQSSKVKGAEKIEAYKELNTYIRKNVIEDKTSYEVTMAFLKEYQKQELQGEESEEVLEFLEPLLDMSYEEFRKTGLAISEFAEYALDVVPKADSNSEKELPEDFAERFGKLLNQSEPIVSMKQLVLQKTVEEVFKSVSDNSSETAQKEALEFIKQQGANGKVEKELQGKEAESIWILIQADNELDVLEGLARHPLFGGQVAADKLTKDIICECYSDADQETLDSLFQKNPTLLNTLKNKLKTYENAPMTEESFSKHVQKTLDDKLGK